MRFTVKWDFMGAERSKSFHCLVEAATHARGIARGLRGLDREVRIECEDLFTEDECPF